MILKNTAIRIARPTNNLQQVTSMYTEGLGFKVVGGFDNHNGFNGRMVGHPDHCYHLEFTCHQGSEAGRPPSEDNLLVFYLPDSDDYMSTVEAAKLAGFKPVPSFNPYWENDGTTLEDVDGYRIVLCNMLSPC